MDEKQKAEREEKQKEEQESDKLILLTQVENLLKCDICLKYFDLNIHLPMVAKCGHTFCKQCIYNGGDNTPFISTKDNNSRRKSGVCPLDNIHHVLGIESCIPNLKLELIIKKIFKYKEPKITEKKIVYHIETKKNNKNNSPISQNIQNREFRSNSGNKYTLITPDLIFLKCSESKNLKKNHSTTDFNTGQDNNNYCNTNVNLNNDELNNMINDDQMNFMDVNQINDDSIEAIPINEERSILNNSFKDEFNELLTKNSNNFIDNNEKKIDEFAIEKNKIVNEEEGKNNHYTITVNKNESNTNCIYNTDIVEYLTTNNNNNKEIKRRSDIYDKTKFKERKTISQENAKRFSNQYAGRNLLINNNSIPKNKNEFKKIKNNLENKKEDQDNKSQKDQKYKILSKKIELKKHLDSNSNSKDKEIISNKNYVKKINKQKIKKITVDTNNYNNIGTHKIFSLGTNNNNLRYCNKSSNSHNHILISAYNKKRLPGKNNLFLTMKNNYCNSLNNSDHDNVNVRGKNVSSNSIKNIKQFTANDVYSNKDISLSIPRKKDYLNNKLNKVSASVSPGTKILEGIKNNYLNSPINSPIIAEIPDNYFTGKYKINDFCNEGIIENKNEDVADSKEINNTNNANSEVNKSNNKIMNDEKMKIPNFDKNNNDENINNDNIKHTNFKSYNIEGTLKSINLNLCDKKGEKKIIKRLSKNFEHNRYKSPVIDPDINAIKNNLKSIFKAIYNQKIESYISKNNSQIKEILINNNKKYEDFINNALNDPKNENLLKKFRIEFLPNGELFLGIFSEPTNLPLKGVTLSLSGDFYEGIFVDGKKEGNGTMIYKNGTRYEGAFKANKHNGFGKLIQLDGETFIGEWKDGKINGNGVRYHKNGDKYIGAYINNIRNGLGHYIFANGDSYEGNWENGKANGIGKFNFKNGNIYEGEFKDNIIYGKGSFKMKNGDLYYGYFENGLISGKGNIIYENGEKFVGFFQKGKKFGKGKVLDKDGKVILTGYWKNDKYSGGKFI